MSELDPSTLLHFTGRCACGDVSFRVDANPSCAVCFCETCRRASGSSGMGWINGARPSLLVDGALTDWRSSSHAVRRHCQRCGSQLFLLEDSDPGIVEVAVGAIDQQAQIEFGHHSYGSSRPAWDRSA